MNILTRCMLALIFAICFLLLVRHTRGKHKVGEYSHRIAAESLIRAGLFLAASLLVRAVISLADINNVGKLLNWLSCLAAYYLLLYGFAFLAILALLNAVMTEFLVLTKDPSEEDNGCNVPPQ